MDIFPGSYFNGSGFAPTRESGLLLYLPTCRIQMMFHVLLDVNLNASSLHGAHLGPTTWCILILPRTWIQKEDEIWFKLMTVRQTCVENVEGKRRSLTTELDMERIQFWQLSVHMCVCVCTCMHAYMHVCVCTCVFVSPSVCLCLCILQF